MDLVDRYLQQVQRFLPAKDRDDIANELRDDILSDVSAQETHLGRPMTEPEMVNLLKHRGHPFLLAQKYRPKQYLLISPGLLPFYWQILKASLALAFLVIVIVASVSAAQGAQPQELIKRFTSFFNVALYIFAWVTVLFAVLDVVHAKLNIAEGWDPRKLPPLTAAKEPVQDGTSAFTELISTGVFLVWWLAVPHYPWVMLGPAANIIKFTPVWHTVYWPVTSPSAVSFVLQVIAIVRPQWRTVRRYRRIATNLLGIGAIMLLLGAGDLVMATGNVPLEPRVVALLNKGVTISLMLALFGAAVQLVTDGYKLARGTMGGSTGHSQAGSETAGS